MNRLPSIFAIALALVLLSGCSTRRDYKMAIDSLLGEMRSIESQYYDLESAYRRQERELQAAQEKLAELEGREDGDQPGEFSVDDGEGVGADGSRSVRESPTAVEQIPELEELNWEAQREQLPETYDAETSAYIAPIDNQISHIVLATALTSGRDLDGHGGDDAISVVIEPRNRANELLAESGRLTVSLIDPDAEGDDQRIGLWTIEEEEAQSRVKMTADNLPGIQLMLPWQERLPQRRDLKLFVRLEAADGGVHETVADIRVALTEDGLHGWTHRPSPASFPLRESENSGALRPLRSTAGVPAWSPYR